METARKLSDISVEAVDCGYLGNPGREEILRKVASRVVRTALKLLAADWGPEQQTGELKTSIRVIDRNPDEKKVEVTTTISDYGRQYHYEQS